MFSTENISQEILSFFLNPPDEFWFLIVKITFIAISAVLAGGLIFALAKSSYIRWRFVEDATEFMTFKPSGVRKLVKAWNKIKGRIDTGVESEYKLAVIEADGVVDDVLRRIGHKGDNLEERLKGLTSATLPNIEDLKEAHRSRTRILHNPDQGLSAEEAEKLLKVYEKALEDLQAF